MNYVISNLSIVPTPAKRNKLIDQVEKLVKKLQILPDHYIYSEVLKLNIFKINNQDFRISCSLKLKNNLVFLSESGKDITAVANDLFDKFRLKVASQIEKERLFYASKSQRERKENFESYFSDLETFQQNQDEVSFKSLVKELLPGLKGYVERMLGSAKMIDVLRTQNYILDDIVDEVIIRTFKNFEENKDQAEDMNIWMMRETDNVMNEMLDLEKYKRITTSVEEMINSEYASLDEKYAYDGSGDLISTSELDEFDDKDTFLGIENEVLVSGSEKETVEEISDKLSRKQMKELIRNELIKLPLRHQSVYDLFFYEQMSVNEIAGIKNESPERIEEILEEVKDFLAKRLKIK